MKAYIWKNPGLHRAFIAVNTASWYLSLARMFQYVVILEKMAVGIKRKDGGR